MEKLSTDKCYLQYSDELEGGGYLICSYNHPVGEECLIDVCGFCREMPKNCKCYEENHE